MSLIFLATKSPNLAIKASFETVMGTYLWAGGKLCCGILSSMRPNMEAISSVLAKWPALIGGRMSPSEVPPEAAWLPRDTVVAVWLSLHSWCPGSSGLGCLLPYHQIIGPSRTLFSTVTGTDSPEIQTTTFPCLGLNQGSFMGKTSTSSIALQFYSTRNILTILG